MIEAAASHASHLMAQGLDPDIAYEHARLRYGVTVAAIKREIDSRHVFVLAEVDEITHEFETFEAARRWCEARS